MAAPAALILGWARSAVVPVGGAFAALEPHALGAPVLQALLRQAGVPAEAVDAVLIGNALGAGGNPARLLALAAGLPDRCAAITVDSQCDAGLDAVSLAVGLLASGQAEVVIAGGVEAWSRAPIRLRRPDRPAQPAQPNQPDAPGQPYERPPFAPDPARDPDLLVAASALAAEIGCSRVAQDAWAVESHRRARAHRAELADEIVPVAGITHDAYPRALTAERAARLPAAASRAAGGMAALPAHAASAADPSAAWSVAGAPADEDGEPRIGTADGSPDTRHRPPSDAPPKAAFKTTLDTTPGLLAVSPKADGAALLLLATPQACARLGLAARALWCASASTGGAPERPMRAAAIAAQLALARAGIASASALAVIELHDAFAVQALDCAAALGLDLEPTPGLSRLNRRGGGLARGHPIGASGAIALVRVLADLARDGRPGDRGLAAIAGAGGIGAAVVVERR